MREPGGVHRDPVWRRPFTNKKLVHLMEEEGVQPLQCLMEQGVAWSSHESEVVKELGVEVDECNKVTISQTRVELESEENKENWERELDRSTIGGPAVRNRIAKAHKFLDEKVIAASLGRIV
jgi:hypothetical protein